MYLLPILTFLTIIFIVLLILSNNHNFEDMQTGCIIILFLIIIFGWGLLGFGYPVKKISIEIDKGEYDLIINEKIIILDKNENLYYYTNKNDSSFIQNFNKDSNVFNEVYNYNMYNYLIDKEIYLVKDSLIEFKSF